MRFRYLLVFLLAVPAARAERLPLKNFTPADGLAHHRVKRIVRDSRGFLWFCTAEGLSRFDGRHFLSFGEKQSVASTSINDLIETRSGDYWVATGGGGIYRLPAGASRFAHFQLGTSGANHVNVLYEDPSGGLLAGTNDGLFAWNSHRNAFEPAGGLHSVAITALSAGPDGTLWFATSRGLMRRIAESRAEIVEGDGEPVRCLMLDRDRNLWAGFSNTVSLISPAGQARSFVITSGTANQDLRALYQSSDGRIWVGSNLGLHELTDRGVKTYAANTGLSGGAVNAITQDRNGNLWIGTDLGGAYKLARNGFISFGREDGLGAAWVGTMVEDATRLYVVNGGRLLIHAFNGTRFNAIQPTLPAETVERSVRFPRLTIRDRAGEWWVPSADGVFRFSSVKRVEDLPTAQPKARYTTRDGLASDNVFRIYEDTRGDIWINSHYPSGNGLTQWVRSTGKLRRYSPAEGLPDRWVFSIGEDASNNIWLGFRGGGVARLRQGRFTAYNVASGGPLGDIWSFYSDRNGGLWIASDGGGATYIASPGSETFQFRTYTRASGLASDSVYCVTEDQWGRMYLGTGRGVDRLNPKTGHIKHYTIADGLAQAEVITAHRDRHGALWFGTYAGLSRLIPDAHTTTEPPPVWISGVRIAGVPHPVSLLGETEVSGLVLQPWESQISIDFVGLAFGVGDTIRYQYRFEGLDQDWSEPVEDRTVNARVSPGNYRFLVRAVSSDGGTSPAPATFAFQVLPPMWQRWWFLLLVFTAATAILYATHRYRAKRLVELERVRTRLATDLHDDIGSSLSQVSMLSELALRRTNADTDVLGPLSQIASLSRDLLDSMSDIVWAVNPDKDHLRDLVHRMRRFASDVFTARDLPFSFHAPPDDTDIAAGADVRREVYLIFKEAVNNVVRHSRCTEARIDLVVQGRWVDLTIADNGRGVVAGDVHDGNGLASMRNRAQRLGGTIEVTSRKGEGTVVRLRVPLSRHK